MSEEHKTEIVDEEIVQEWTLTDLPKQYKVVIHNDDYTPMEFVVEVLVKIFGKDRATATEIMWNVHLKGKGVCGVYSYEIAEMKVSHVHELATRFEHPLKASMEAE